MDTLERPAAHTSVCGSQYPGTIYPASSRGSHHHSTFRNLVSCCTRLIRSLMAGIFRPGQLVGLNELTSSTGTTELYNVPGGTDDVRIIGRLFSRDVALVVAVHQRGASVYVVGPSGGGWAFGAQLKSLPVR